MVVEHSSLNPLLLEILACPKDKGSLIYFEDEQILYNPRLQMCYEIRRGIPVMLIAEAKKQGMKIIGLHIGGKSRRGEMSDKFLTDAVPACDYVIVVGEANDDGLFSKLTGSKVTLDTVEKISKLGDPLGKAFK